MGEEWETLFYLHMNIDTSPPNVLLADQDAKVRSTLESFFRQVGWSYEIVENARLGLAALEKRSFDIVIAEFEMPAIEGSGFIHALRDKNPDQTLLALTSECSAERAIECLRHGVVDIITKPVDLITLEATVLKSCNSRRDDELGSQQFKNALSEFTSYVFQTGELAGHKLPLVIAEKLYRAARITLSLKLKLQLTFDEAITNSLDHGNLELNSAWREEIDKSGIDRYAVVKKARLSDPHFSSRKLFVDVHYTGSQLKISLRDEGRGFKPPPAKLRRPNPQNPNASELYCYGRGLSIMHSVMDDVFYSEDGRQLTLVKNLGEKAWD